ncbi:MAG: hypothetical protein P8Y28_15370 [Gammaproteobacteria bacterium]
MNWIKITTVLFLLTATAAQAAETSAYTFEQLTAPTVTWNNLGICGRFRCHGCYSPVT